MKKFELTDETKIAAGRTLHRIRALRDFGPVRAGELGGFVEKEENLDHAGNARVWGDARVSGDARVWGDAWVSGDARVWGGALVYGNARVSGDARVAGNARVSNSNNNAVVWFTHVGSENGTLTVYRCEKGLGVTRGCFTGTDAEFLEAVAAHHGTESKIGREYRLLIEVARSRLQD